MATGKLIMWPLLTSEIWWSKLLNHLSLEEFNRFCLAYITGKHQTVNVIFYKVGPNWVPFYVRASLTSHIWNETLIQHYRLQQCTNVQSFKGSEKQDSKHLRTWNISYDIKVQCSPKLWFYSVRITHNLSTIPSRLNIWGPFLYRKFHRRKCWKFESSRIFVERDERIVCANPERLQKNIGTHKVIMYGMLLESLND